MFGLFIAAVLAGVKVLNGADSLTIVNSVGHFLYIWILIWTIVGGLIMSFVFLGVSASFSKSIPGFLAMNAGLNVVGIIILAVNILKIYLANLVATSTDLARAQMALFILVIIVIIQYVTRSKDEKK